MGTKLKEQECHHFRISENPVTESLNELLEEDPGESSE